MICDKNKIIFIHIPKCAGSSLEKMFGYKPFNIKKSNRVNLLGWDDEVKSFLQHSTTKEIFDYNLIDGDVWGEYNKFTIIRNPWDRVRSAYVGLMNDTKIKDSFENFLYREGKFKNVLTNRNNSNYRGHYIDPQIKFIEHNFDDLTIFRFEKLNEINQYFKRINIDKIIPHTNKTPNPINFNTLYNDVKHIEMVREVYSDDIKLFNYSFKKS